MGKTVTKNVATNQTTFGHDDMAIRVSFIGKNDDGSVFELNNYFDLQSAVNLFEGLYQEICKYIGDYEVKRNSVHIEDGEKKWDY